MTVSLGGIALSDHLTLTIGPQAPAITQQRLIGGSLCIQIDPTLGGRELILAGDNHWTLDQVEAIRALEAAGSPVTLIHHRGTFAVLIADTTGLTPTIDYADPTAADWYSGAITLIEV